VRAGVSLRNINPTVRTGTERHSLLSILAHQGLTLATTLSPLKNIVLDVKSDTTITVLDNLSTKPRTLAKDVESHDTLSTLRRLVKADSPAAAAALAGQPAKQLNASVTQVANIVPDKLPKDARQAAQRAYAAFTSNVPERVLALEASLQDINQAVVGVLSLGDSSTHTSAHVQNIASYIRRALSKDPRASGLLLFSIPDNVMTMIPNRRERKDGGKDRKGNRSKKAEYSSELHF
jgi:hypothetical protein